MSIDATYLSSIADKFKSDIAKAVINNTIEISSFELEQVTDQVYELIFNVLAFDTTQIDNIKLKKADDTLIISDNVDIPITEDEVVIRHLITINEEVS